jgi:hypothetical protein
MLESVNVALGQITYYLGYWYWDEHDETRSDHIRLLVGRYLDLYNIGSAILHLTSSLIDAL